MLAGLLTLSGVYYYHYHYSGSRGDYTVHQTERASLDQLSQVKNRDKVLIGLATFHLGLQDECSLY